MNYLCKTYVDRNNNNKSSQDDNNIVSSQHDNNVVSSQKITKMNNKRSFSTSCFNAIQQNPTEITSSVVPFNLSNNVKLQKKSLMFDYSPIYLAVENILKDNSLTPYDKQINIEKILSENWLELYLEDFKSSENNKDYVRMLNSHIKSFSNSLALNLSSIKNKKLLHLRPLLNLPINVTALLVFKILFPILFSGEDINKTSLVIKIGKSIFTKWAKFEFHRIKENSNIDNVEDFSVFKDNLNFSEKDFLNIGDLVFNTILNNSNIFHINIDNTDPHNTRLVVSPNEKVQLLLEKKIEIIGFKLPMISPPVKWNSKTYGGYLNNGVEFDPLIKPSRKSSLKTTLNGDKKHIIYNTINYMSQIPYRINIEVLNFILENYEKLGLKTSIHPATNNYYTSTRKIKTEIENNNSLFYLSKNIIGLAKLLSNVSEFYFPLSLDWRGRIYCLSNYLTTQGNELSKSLILFSNGTPLTRSHLTDDDETQYVDNGLRYLKVYGANLYGLDKHSIVDRINWVDDNHSKILEMDINFILKASEPLLFIAFSFEFKNYHKDPDNFVSRLPISLDATCSG